MGLTQVDPQTLDFSQAPSLCRHLENGEILYFAKRPFLIPPQDIDFLLKLRQVDSRFRKNVAYKPAQGRVSGAATQSAEDRKRLLQIMRGFSESVTSFLELLIAPYADTWRLDYASFRPEQEKGRDLKVNARNDLLHVDAFPTRPTYGNRILRFFVNISPQESRRWITSDPFDELVKLYAGSESMPLPREAGDLTGRIRRSLLRKAKRMGLPVAAPSRYDEFMLRFHDYLKTNRSFQQECPKFHWEFPPGCAWMVFTDSVPHAALSGQFALEQTFIIDRRSLIQPEKAPISVLEELTGVGSLGR